VLGKEPHSIQILLSDHTEKLPRASGEHIMKLAGYMMDLASVTEEGGAPGDLQRARVRTDPTTAAEGAGGDGVGFGRAVLLLDWKAMPAYPLPLLGTVPLPTQHRT